MRQTTQLTCDLHRQRGGRYVMGAQITADKQSGPTEQGPLAAEHHAALREAFAALPPSGQRLIALLLRAPVTAAGPGGTACAAHPGQRDPGGAGPVPGRAAATSDIGVPAPLAATPKTVPG